METSLTRHEMNKVKSSLKQLKYTGAGSQSKFLRKIFGEDLAEVKEYYDAANSAPRIFQVEELVKTYVMLEKMRAEYAEKGVLPKQFDKIQKNHISLLDKMRRQDEGIKVQGQISIDMDRFREVIDVQEAKVIDAEVIKQQKKIVRESSIFQAERLEE